MVDRARLLDGLYLAIGRLREHIGGSRRLESCDARSGWPTHGLYLFFEEGEVRADGVTPRVTRVGTHALTATSRTTLWQRLATHRGTVGGRSPGGGNHRGSIFRLHVGTALIERDRWTDGVEAWGKGGTAPRDVRAGEVPLERAVSAVIGQMPLLWVPVEDRHDRQLIERDLIAALSTANPDCEPIDPPSTSWLGRWAGRDAIRRSGLWNVMHVDDQPTGDGVGRFIELIGCSSTSRR